MPESVLDFWFVEHGPKQWWRKDAAFDELCRQRFATLHRRAAACELYAWRGSAGGRLAEIMLLDQLSRNMFRDSPRAFAYDAQALTLAQEAVRAGADRDPTLSAQQRQFLLMPYMHSESQQVHVEALRLFTALGDDDVLKFEQRHKDIIDRFGRYPHRNALLGRASSAEEQEFLRQPGSSF